MNIKYEIEKYLRDDIMLVQKIENLMVKVDILSDNKKDMLLAGFSRNVLSHFVSINYLIQKKLYNSSFALERIFFENIIRLRYMNDVMNDTKIEIIYSANSWNNHFPSIEEMVKEIDTVLGVKFYSEIKDRTYKIMNDYTHTGVNQIASNFSESLIDSNFSDELILDTLEGNRALLKTTIIVFLENVGLKNGFISEDEMKEYLDY